MTAAAFAPAHVSGLFAVHDEAADALAKGSRGAGWSLERGAVARVARAPATSHGRLRVEGTEADLPVTRRALDRLAPAVPLDVDLTLQLPVGQGFGMSAAGTLAACLAAAAELGLETDDALAAAHAAEVASGTGLGDAVGSWTGAGEVRTRPGVPPRGHVLRVEPPDDATFLLAVAGEPIPTPKVIRDPTWAARTRQLGDAAVDRIVAARQDGAWQAILQESARFSRDLGLMPPRLAQLGAMLDGLAGTWGQAMLGSTLWCTGPADDLREAEARLRAAGVDVLRLGVDRNGARLVRV